MATIRLPPDFKEFLKLLREHKVHYLLIGGYAVGFHGYPRATANMDIWVERLPDNATRIVTVLKEFGFNLAELTPALFLEENQIIRMGVPPVKLEIFTSISGVEFNKCFKDRIVTELDGVEVDLISLKDLKDNKKARLRSKDITDLENLP